MKDEAGASRCVYVKMGDADSWKATNRSFFFALFAITAYAHEEVPALFTFRVFVLSSSEMRISKETVSH